MSLKIASAEAENALTHLSKAMLAIEKIPTLKNAHMEGRLEKAFQSIEDAMAALSEFEE